jgi:hypothetical protein
MKGLYLLTSNLLEHLKTVKFGMSMRLENRWVDYQKILLNDSRYLYYYEIIDEITQEEIMKIEEEIIKTCDFERNMMFQEKYFLCDDYKKFNDKIEEVLKNNNIKYKMYNKHNFQIKNYDNNKEEIRNDIKMLYKL